MIILRTAFFYAVVAALLFAVVWARGLVLAPDDGLHYFVPAFLSTERVWESRLFCGFPAHADPQTMFTYPLRHGPGGLPGWNAFVIAGYVIAGTFFHRWIARATKSELAGVVGGLAFAFSGYPMSHLRHVNVVHAAAWVPAILLAIDRLSDATTGRRVATLAAAVALEITAGHPQTTAIFAPVLAAYGALRAYVAPAALRPRIALGATAGAALGLAAAAVLVLPMMEFAARGARATGASLDTPPAAFEASALVRTIVSPAWRGGSTSPEARGFATEAFVGVAGLALAAGAMGRRRRRELFWAGAAVLGVVLAFGDANPLSRAIVESPLFGTFRVPARFLAVTHLALVALACFGIAAFARRRIAAIAAAVLLLETASFAAFSEWRFASPPSGAFDRPAFLEPVASTLAASGQRLVPISGRLSRPEGAPVNRNALWGIPSPAGYNPLLTEESARLFHLSSLAQIPWEHVLGPHVGADLAATRYLTALIATPRDEAAVVDGGRWKRIESMGELFLFERTEPMPRAVLVPAADVLPRETILQTVERGAFPDGALFDPRVVALIESPLPALAGRAPAPESPLAPVELNFSGGRIVRAHIRTEHAALLVLADSYDSGWRAKVDGAPAPVVRTNYNFCGVLVGPGARVVEFDYRPASLMRGAAVSAAALVTLLVLAARPQRRKNANAPVTIVA